MEEDQMRMAWQACKATRKGPLSRGNFAYGRVSTALAVMLASVLVERRVVDQMQSMAMCSPQAKTGVPNERAGHCGGDGGWRMMDANVP